jgi:scyllo-inositol 2-dehydrogenase (NADP+)
MIRPDEAVRVGLIGFGGSARTIHVPLIRSVRELNLVAAIPTTDAARERAVEAGVSVVDTVQHLVDLGVEVAVIATPDVAHVAGAEAAMAAGLDVVVEKPVAPTVKAAKKLELTATWSGLRVVPFQNRRWDSDCLTVRRLLREQAVGQPIRFESRLTRWSPTVSSNWRDQHRPGTLDGRLADLGAHLVDQAMVLFGPVEEVYAEIDSVRPGAVANDDCFVSLRHDSGVLTHLHMSAVSAARLPRMRLQGLGGSYLKYGSDPQQDALASGRTPGEADWGRERDEEAGTLTTADAEHAVISERGDWGAFYRGIAAMRAHGAPAPVALGDAIAVLRVLEAAQASARDRCVVGLQLIDPEPKELG